MKNLILAVDWTTVTKPITDFLASAWIPIVAVLSVAAVLWGIYVGVQWVRSGDNEEERAKAKKLLKNTILGVVIGAVLIVALPLLISTLVEWAQGQ